MTRSLARSASSIASRVATGMQSIASRRRSIGLLWRRRFRIGCARRRAARAPPGGSAPSVGCSSAPRNEFPLLKGNLHMKLGVHIGYWGLGLSSEDQLNIVQEAERLGYDSGWAAEASVSDTATVLGWLAGQTSKIRLGSGIFQMPGRSPAMTAMTAATIDQLSNGRMLLRVGSPRPPGAGGRAGRR